MRCINQESYFLRNDYQKKMRRIQHLWEVVQRLSKLFHKHEILSFFKIKDCLTFLEKRFRRREGLQTIKWFVEKWTKNDLARTWVDLLIVLCRIIWKQCKIMGMNDLENWSSSAFKHLTTNSWLKSHPHNCKTKKKQHLCKACKTAILYS